MEPVIHHHVLLACSPHSAFEHFTRNDLLVKFFTNEAEVEARLGGKYELAWDPENKPQDSTVGCRITALEADQLLAFDWRGPTKFDAIMNHVLPLTHVVISFHLLTNHPAPACDVNLVHSGWRPGPEWGEPRAYFERAWGQVLEALVDLIGAPAVHPQT